MNSKPQRLDVSSSLAEDAASTKWLALFCTLYSLHSQNTPPLIVRTLGEEITDAKCIISQTTSHRIMIISRGVERVVAFARELNRVSPGRGSVLVDGFSRPGKGNELTGK